jgi:hypothetical protein
MEEKVKNPRGGFLRDRLFSIFGEDRDPAMPDIWKQTVPRGGEKGVFRAQGGDRQGAIQSYLIAIGGRRIVNHK